MGTQLLEGEATPFFVMIFRRDRNPTIGLLSTIELGLGFSSFPGEPAKLVPEQHRGKAGRPGLVQPAGLFVHNLAGHAATTSTNATLLIT